MRNGSDEKGHLKLFTVQPVLARRSVPVGQHLVNTPRSAPVGGLPVGARRQVPVGARRQVVGEVALGTRNMRKFHQPSQCEQTD